MDKILKEQLKKVRKIYNLGNVKVILLLEALTTSEYHNEEKHSYNNKPLAIIGDAIIKTIISSRLYGDKLNEEQITEKKKDYESNNNIAQVIDRMGIFKYAKSKEDDQYVKSKLISVTAKATMFEAIVGAIYKNNNNYNAAKQFVDQWI